MNSRRSFLAAGATGALALSAGCLGFALGNEPLEFDAERAAPSASGLEATGYEERESKREGIEETIDVGVTREISASYWVSTYAKAVDLRAVVEDDLEDERDDADGDVDENESDDVDEEVDGEGADVEDELDGADLEDELDADLEALENQEAAFFAAVSMPAMEVLGTSYNPLEGLEGEELLDELRAESGEDAGLSAVESAGSTSLSILGESRDVDVFEAVTEAEDEEIELEALLAAFAHEEDFVVLFGGYPAALEDEREALEELFESVEHPNPQD